MSLGTYLQYEKSILDWFLQPDSTVKKKFGVDYEQLLRPILLCFHGQKINSKFFKNILGSSLKSCIE